jgi:hypothetical protein
MTGIEEYVPLIDMSDCSGSSSGNADDEYSSSCSDDTTYSDMEENLNGIVDMLTFLRDGLKGMNSHVKTLEEPMMEVLLEQMTDPSHLETSPFRKATFRLAVALPTLNIERRYPYKDIVEKLRQYIFNEGLVLPDGQIRINQTLRTLFEFQDSEVDTTFPKLLQKLRHVLV